MDQFDDGWGNGRCSGISIHGRSDIVVRSPLVTSVRVRSHYLFPNGGKHHLRFCLVGSDSSPWFSVATYAPSGIIRN
jgi:hypothetical protein